MAYVSQEKKARIAAELKKVMPKDWKYSLAVNHHSTIVLTISAAPVDLISLSLRDEEFRTKTGYIQLNQYHLAREYASPILEAFTSIRAALNIDNHDRSDAQTDYFDVGHYVNINIGRWDKPFVALTEKTEMSYDELKARIAALETQAV